MEEHAMLQKYVTDYVSVAHCAKSYEKICQKIMLVPSIPVLVYSIMMNYNKNVFHYFFYVHVFYYFYILHGHGLQVVLQ